MDLREEDPQRGLWDIAEMLEHPDGVITRWLRLVDPPRSGVAADFVLIDTPPALDGSLPVLAEADWILVPAIPETEEVRQLEKFLNTLETTYTARPFTRLLGIVPVRYIKAWEAHHAMLDEIGALAASLATPSLPRSR